MNSVHSPYSLPWRLAVAIFLLDLAISVAGTGYDLLTDEYAQQIREHYSNATVIITMAAFVLTNALLPGVASWCWAHGWLRRRGASAVEHPGRVLLILIVALLAFYFMAYAGMASLQARMDQLYTDWWAPWSTETLGLYQGNIQFALFMPIRVLPAVLVRLAGTWLCLRLALMSSRPSGAPRAALTAGQAASVAALTLVLWQTIIGSYMANAVSPIAGEREYWPAALLGYLLVPALLYGVGLWAALRGMRHAPRGASGCGRAVLLGSLAFWLAQVLGVALLYLFLLFGWPLLVLGSAAVVVLGLLAYGALVFFGMWIMARLLYRRGAGNAQTPGASGPQGRLSPTEAA